MWVRGDRTAVRASLLRGKEYNPCHGQSSLAKIVSQVYYCPKVSRIMLPFVAGVSVNLATISTATSPRSATSLPSHSPAALLALHF